MAFRILSVLLGLSLVALLDLSVEASSQEADYVVPAIAAVPASKPAELQELLKQINALFKEQNGQKQLPVDSSGAPNGSSISTALGTIIAPVIDQITKAAGAGNLVDACNQLGQKFVVKFDFLLKILDKDPKIWHNNQTDKAIETSANQLNAAVTKLNHSPNAAAPCVQPFKNQLAEICKPPRDSIYNIKGSTPGTRAMGALINNLQTPTSKTNSESSTLDKWWRSFRVLFS